MLELFVKCIYIFGLLLFPVVGSFSMETNVVISDPRPAIPVNAIDGVIAAFDSHSIVALGEGMHNNEQGHLFRLSLIRDPRFAATVDDIVVEFGNARFQDVMDRFVNGEDISHAILRKVWQDTTQSHGVWDVPIYEEFFSAVRAVNQTLPKDQRLRVLLGDPPIDWEYWSDDQKWDRDGYPAELIQREVIAKHRRALVIYGDMHFLRRPLDYVAVDDENSAPQGNEVPHLAELLERNGTTKLFTIWTYTYGGDINNLQADLQSWPQPSLSSFRGSILGAQDFEFYFPGPTRMQFLDGQPRFFKVKPGKRMEDYFDALLYLGPVSNITYSELPIEFCTDTTYIEMRTHRTALNGGGFGWAEEFKKDCERKINKIKVQEGE